MPEQEERRPFQTLWVTRADVPNSHFCDCLTRLGGAVEHVDPHFRGDVIIDGTLRTVRGKAKFLIYDRKDCEYVDERLEKAGLRVWTQGEQDAYEALPDADLGGMRYKQLPTEKDVQKLKSQNPPTDQQTQPTQPTPQKEEPAAQP